MKSILLASDAPSVRAEVRAVLDGPGVEILEASSGPEVVSHVAERRPDLVVVDLQMGNMGGMAVCLELRLEESYGELAHVPVLMLLDRRADVFLARRSGAEGWLVKPLDPIRIRRAVDALLGGGTYFDESYQPLVVRALVPEAQAGDGAAGLLLRGVGEPAGPEGRGMEPGAHEVEGTGSAAHQAEGASLTG